MDKYLLEILKDVNTIIIPELGALTITNADTGEIMFMPFLKHDDGKLSAYIAEKEGMDENEAKNLIAKYVREINAKLDQGESYDMFKFGSFSKSADGDVEFNNWDSSKKEETPKPEAKPEPKKEAKKEAKKEPMVEKKVEEKSKKKEDKPVDKKAEPKKETKAKAKPAAKKAEPQKETPKEEPKPAPKKEEETKKAEKESTPKAAAPIKTKAEMNVAEKEELAKNEEKLAKLRKESEKEEKKKRSTGFYILITLIVVIVAGGTYVGLNYDDVKQHIPFLADNEEKEAEKTEMDKMKETLGLTGEDKEESDSEEEITEPEETEEVSDTEEETDTEVEETAPEPEPEPVPEPKPAPELNNNGKPYHIVAGAFSSADNAERLAQSLRDQGYPSSTFLRGSMTIVSVSAHASNADAAAALQNVKGDVPKAWILYWK